MLHPQSPYVIHILGTIGTIQYKTIYNSGSNSKKISLYRNNRYDPLKTSKINKNLLFFCLLFM